MTSFGNCAILGPLLFIIYVNDITVSSNIFKFIMYADDTTLFTIINCFDNNEHPNQYINNELSKISEWLIVNKLSLNASKTNYGIQYASKESCNSTTKISRY